VTRLSIKKDATMRSKLALLLLATAAAGCSYTPHDLPDRGVEAVHTPVVTRADYVFDVAAPGGQIAPSEKARLDAWFRGLGLGYGDSIYVDAPFSEGARYEVAQVASNYAMTVQPGAPVTSGAVPEGMVRVIVTRARADVPGCPDWSQPSEPNFNNRTMSNYGCGVNSNIAAMVANPEDLVHGREGTGIGDPVTGAKAIAVYRSTAPTGSKGLQEVSTQKKDSQ
jgi:pilus assembly protein CpaD